MPATSPYAELHCLSNFSFLRGASHPEELVARAHELGYAALAITDECSLAGVVRAHVAAKQVGLKLIIGAEIQLEDGLRLVLLATNRDGYGNLSQLITQGRRSAEKGSYFLQRVDLEDGLPDCIALLLPDVETKPQDVAWLAERFPDSCWLAYERLLGPDDEQRLQQAQKLSASCHVPLVAAGDVHMHVRGRRALQDTLTAIRLGMPVKDAGFALHPNGECHLRTRSRLAKLYPSPLLVETIAIAERCTFSLDSLRYEYPRELVPTGETADVYLHQLVKDGLQRRFPHGVPDKVRRMVEHELTLVRALQYEPYFLTVHDIVVFARSHGILCQGRGSAANSAVCYALGITEVDPSRMEMLFERFISSERNEPPDIDVDFEHERREEVIQYLYTKYGRERAALAAAVISYRPKSAMRDVGKALGLNLDQVDRLAKSMSWWDGRRVLPERLQEAGFDPDSPRIRQLIVLVNELVGFPRHLSQHVGGFVIARDALSRLVPITNAAMPDRTVIEWDKDDLDALGLLKVDVLALGMLTAIRRALGLVSTWHGKLLTMADIPAEDPQVYAMIQHADVMGVFQIESRAQMAMLPRMKPRSFYDLVIEVAIVRPGPIQGGMVHPYLRRRQGLEPVSYPSETVKSVLHRTLGVPIFQEQVMQIAMVAAGFTPGEADRLRRSMAAWKRRGGMEHFEQRLISGMRERGYTEEFAHQIYQQILGFGEYGFPESHAASFALLVYVSAWLKCHEPAAFTCALLNSQPMGFYAPSQLVQDARRHGVEVRAVDVMASGWDCSLEPPAKSLLSSLCQREEPTAPAGLPPLTAEGSLRQQRGPAGVPLAGKKGGWGGFRGNKEEPALRLGLRMIHGLSRAGAEHISAARRDAPFTSVEDLAARAALDQRDLKALAAAGALASLTQHRRAAYWEVAGIEDKPPLFHHVSSNEEKTEFPAPSEAENLVADYASLGLTLGRHPLALLRATFIKQRMLTAEQIRQTPDGKLVRAVGLVTGRQRPDTASGVIFVTLEDETGYVNVVVWSRLAEKQRRELLQSSLLGVYGRLERQGEVAHLIAGRLVDYSELLGQLEARSRDFH